MIDYDNDISGSLIGNLLQSFISADAIKDNEVFTQKYKGKWWFPFALWWIDYGPKNLREKSALLTYKSLIALIPIAACIVLSARLFLKTPAEIKNSFMSMLQGIPQDDVEALIDKAVFFLQVKETEVSGFSSYLAPIIAVLISFFFVYNLIAAYDMILDSIWPNGTPKRKGNLILQIMRTVTTVFALALLVFLGDWLVQLGDLFWFKELSVVLLWLFRFVIFFILVIGIIKFLPRIEIQWKHALISSVVIAFVFTFLQFICSILISYFANRYASYGSLSGIILALFWLRIAWLTLLVGANYCYKKQYSGKDQKTYQEVIIKTWLAFSIVQYIYSKGKSSQFTDLKEHFSKLPLELLMSFLKTLEKDKIINKDTLLLEENSLISPAFSVKTFTIGEFLTKLKIRDLPSIPEDANLDSSIVMKNIQITVDPLSSNKPISSY